MGISQGTLEGGGGGFGLRCGVAGREGACVPQPLKMHAKNLRVQSPQSLLTAPIDPQPSTLNPKHDTLNPKP